MDSGGPVAHADRDARPRGCAGRAAGRWTEWGEMADGFDINDRGTWDWINGGQVTSDWARDPAKRCAIDPTSERHLYQIGDDGLLYRLPCGPGSKFDPEQSACVLDVVAISEADIYQWAVSQGLVTDQR